MKNILLSLVLCIMFLSFSTGTYAVILFQDNFDRADNSTIGNGWTESAAAFAQILGNRLILSKTGSTEYLSHSFISNITGNDGTYIVSYNVRATFSSIGNGDLYSALFTDDTRGTQMAVNKLHNNGGPSCGTGLMLTYDKASPYGACVLGVDTSPVTIQIKTYYNRTASSTIYHNVSINGGAYTQYVVNQGMLASDANNNVTFDFEMSSAAGTSASMSIDDLIIYSESIPASPYEVFTAINSFTGASIQNFTVTAVETNSSATYTNTTTTSSASLALSVGTYNITLSGTGFNPSSVIALLNVSGESMTLYTLPSNTVNMSFLNLTSGLATNSSLNVTIKSSQNGILVSTNTITGNKFNLTGLAVGAWDFEISSPQSAFSTAYYRVTVSTNSFQNLNVWLSPINGLPVNFYMKDAVSLSAIYGAILSIYAQINGTYQLVLSRASDSTGLIAFTYNAATNYFISGTAADYGTTTGYLTPISQSSYFITLSKTTSSVYTGQIYSGISLIVSPSRLTDNAQNNFTVAFSSPSGSFSSMSASLLCTRNATTTTATSSNAYGAVLNLTRILNLSTNDVCVMTFSYTLTSGQSYTDSVTLVYDEAGTGTLMQNKDNLYGLSFFDAIFIAVVTTLLLAGLTFMYAGAVASIISAMFLMGFFTFISLLPLWLGAISMLGLFFALTKYGV